MCAHVQIFSYLLDFRTTTFLGVARCFLWLLVRLLVFTTVQGVGGKIWTAMPNKVDQYQEWFAVSQNLKPASVPATAPLGNIEAMNSLRLQ